MRCTERGCRGVMHLKVRAACQDGYHWVCTRTRCKKTRSLRIGSFFSKSHLSLGDITCLLYCWAVGMTMSTTSTKLNISKHTVVDFFNFIREECSAKLLRLPVPIWKEIDQNGTCPVHTLKLFCTLLCTSHKKMGSLCTNIPTVYICA